jgi:tRNA nucleotidyltransferase (CCA-adding enzyme)
MHKKVSLYDFSQHFLESVVLAGMSMNVPVAVMAICRTLKNSGYEAWLVGGAVRDALLGRDAHDFDIATDARPEAVMGLFSKVIATGLKHGTVTVMMCNGSYEITTFRGDGTYSDGRRPDEVTFLNTIEEDLARRDFTVNAIAYDPIADKFCDPFGGRDDLDAHQLCAVGDPLARFSEDGLRILRAARFSATLDFNISPKTLGAMCLSLDTLAKVSVERVRDEFLKAMQAKRPSIAFDTMLHTGMLKVIAPELMPMVNCAQNKYHAFDVWYHTMATLDAVPQGNTLLRMAALLHDVGKPQSKGVHEVTGDATFYEHEVVGAEIADKFLARMKFSTKERGQIVHLVRHHYIRYDSSWSNAAVRRWVRKVWPENVKDLCILARADIAGKGPSEVTLNAQDIDVLESKVATVAVNVPTTTNALAISGKDVMDCLGVGPGPTVGRVLRVLLDRVTEDPNLNEKEALLALVREVSVY